MDRGVDFIYWLDADITVESLGGSVEALRMLHEAIRGEGVGIVSGLFPAKNSRRPCAYVWNSGSGRYDLMDYGDFSDGLRMVDAVGMGCVLMKAEIFGRLDPPWFKCDDEYEDYGEDIGFCRRAKEAGFGIVVHPGVVLGHLGIFKLTVEGALEKPM